MYLKRIIPKMIPAIILLYFILQTMILSSAETPSDTELRYTMSYIYFGSTGSYISHVDRTNGSLDEISPNYFNLNKDGSLALTPATERTFIDEMHRRDISVVPFLSNHWDRELGQAALARREELAGQLAEAVERYDLDGVNVDIENLTENERDLHTDFIRILRDKLPDEKLIGVSVAANPYGITTGWKGSYDYESLGKHSDYLMIMAYDEHYRGGEPGTVASISLAEKSIQYALSKVPKEKILLGIPFYGRIWKNGSGFPQGVGISNMEVQTLVSQYEGAAAFDPETFTPTATIKVKEKDEKLKIRGIPIGPGTYTICYENELSIKQKLRLIEKYDIKGTGSWSLGEETADTWEYYKLWSNGCYFDDVGKHWARDYIIKAYKKNWVMGVTQTTFCPDRPLTRAEASAMLVRLLKLPAQFFEESTFTDVSGHWAEGAIDTAWSHNIVKGVAKDRFEPEAPITREQMAVILHSVLEPYTFYGEGKPLSFSDVSPESNPWSWEAIEHIDGLGIISGFGDGSFRPKEALTRGQMTVIMSKLEKICAK